MLEKPWAGTRLGNLRGRPGDAIGESWEFSTVAGHVSRSGGQPLDEIFAGSIPLLAKLIDTARALSVQVHPEDSPARMGKEEAWVILDAEPDAHVLCGVDGGITADQVADAVRAAADDRTRGDALLAMLTRIPVRRGTCILVPAGTIHAIGGGILLAEIQQPTDCTFRIFDYGSGRDLHVDDAIAATVLEARPQVWHSGAQPRALEGNHVRLEIIAADAVVAGRKPTVIVAVDDMTVSHDDVVVALAAGDLCLVTTTVHLSGGLAVAGTCTG